MVGIVDPENMYRKSDHNAKDIKLINEHLADAREADLEEQEEEKITAVNVTLGVDEQLHQKIRNIIHKHEYLWPRKRRERDQPLNISLI